MRKSAIIFIFGIVSLMLLRAVRAELPAREPITVANALLLEQFAAYDHSVEPNPDDPSWHVPVQWMRFSPDGRWMAHVNDDRMWFIDVVTGSERQILLPEEELEVTFSPDWSMLAYYFDRELRVWDV